MSNTLDDQVRRDHEEFKYAVHEEVAALDAITPEQFRKRYWFVLCHDSIDAFSARFQTAEARRSAIDDVKKIHGFHSMLEGTFGEHFDEGELEEIVIIDLSVDDSETED